jgi:signal transduction histidine kinase
MADKLMSLETLEAEITAARNMAQQVIRAADQLTSHGTRLLEDLRVLERRRDVLSRALERYEGGPR